MLFTAFVRTIFFYFFLLIMLRIMGKREIGGLAPIDLAVTIMMAELAAIPIQDPEMPILVGAIPIATIMLLGLVLSGLSLRNTWWRELINGKPNIVIKDGKFVPQEMRSVRYTVHDVLEQLRRAGYSDIADVEVAVLETDGNLSVIPKSQSRPLAAKDLKLPTHYEGLPYTLIVDGEVFYAHLDQCGLDLSWLQSELKKRGIQDVRDVFCAILDTQGELFIQMKEPTKWYAEE